MPARRLSIRVSMIKFNINNYTNCTIIKEKRKMREFRLSKGVTERYTSLEELGQAFGCKPYIKQTKDKEKLKKQRENFCNHYRCRACGEPMVWMGELGESVMICKNEKCKGIKHERIDTEGNTIVSYSVSYEILDNKFADRAKNIFHEF